ncbi:hypothetical protein ACHAXH_009461 [Discostella pseudostelligera]
MATPLDLEQSAPLRKRLATPNNNHGDTAGSGQRTSSLPPPPMQLPARHPLQIMKRSSIIGGSLYAFYDFNVYHILMHHPKINHEWFKIGLASSVAILGLKGYVELYQGKKQNKAVEYEHFKSATHWTIFFILVSWISFHMALSPVYGLVKTWLIMIGFGYGVLIQSALMIPVWGQNILAFVLMTFFLQMYQ